MKVYCVTFPQSSSLGPKVDRRLDSQLLLALYGIAPLPLSATVCVEKTKSMCQGLRAEAGEVQSRRWSHATVKTSPGDEKVAGNP